MADFIYVGLTLRFFSLTPGLLGVDVTFLIDEITEHRRCNFLVNRPSMPCA